MRHSIWFTDPHEQRPAPRDSTGRSATPDGSAPRRGSARATLRLRVRSLCAFAAMVLFLASAIELLAVAMSREGATVPFGVAGICIAIAIVSTLLVTREPRR